MVYYLWIYFFLVSILAGALLYCLCVYLYRLYSNWNVSKGHLIYKLDLVKRKILLLPTNFNISYNFSILPQQIKPGKWKKLDIFLKNFEKSPKNLNKIREIVNYSSLEQEEKEHSFVFKSLNLKNSFLIKIKIIPIHGESDFQMHLSWSRIEKNKLIYKLKPISREEVAKNSKKFKGFVAFYINNNIPNSNEHFLKLMSTKIRSKKHYFISQNLIIFTFFSRTSKRSSVKVSRFINNVRKKEIILGRNRFFMGTSYALTKNVESTTKINSFVNFLKFCCFLSNQNDKSFVSKESSLFINNEYLDFLKGWNKLKNIIRTKSFEVDHKTIVDQQNKRKIINYYFPKFGEINYEQKNILLKDLFYKDSILNYFCEKLVFDQKNQNKSFLVDVSDQWIINNYEKLFLKKVIYVINIHNKRKIPKELTNVLQKLSDKGFFLALKVRKDHVIIENLMNSVNFKFFIIETDFLSNFSYWNYIDLILIKNISVKNKVRMIFEGENQHLDKAQKERIGFRFFY